MYINKNCRVGFIKHYFCYAFKWPNLKMYKADIVIVVGMQIICLMR